eukprot:GHRR01000408.1.p1 GENE.GHRR01000408.1~~GHRR01000408.1.p1  ORF type:complete len:373 (+),score=84.90 GHRR01000408.1:288-1406(+)
MQLLRAKRLPSTASTERATTVQQVTPASALLGSSTCSRQVVAARSATVGVQATVEQIPTGLAKLAVPVATEPVGVLEQTHREDFHSTFTLGEILGQGSYGTVRACTDAGTGKQYAVKILSKKKGGEDKTDVIIQEVHLWQQLSGSPNIAQLAGVYQDGNNIFIVQELLTGGDLQALLDTQLTLSEQEAAVAMHGVLSALAACHSAGICYGDVKPSNFMLAGIYPSVAHVLDPSQPKGDMQLRAVDFGCAQYCPDGCGILQGLSGTPVYMAPEVITDQCSLSMDVWAAGVMLYQMLTGQFPFWDTDMAGLARIHPRQILKDVQNAQVLIDAPCCDGLSAEVKEFIMAMLEQDPIKRISAAQALQHPWIQQTAK